MNISDSSDSEHESGKENYDVASKLVENQRRKQMRRRSKPKNGKKSAKNSIWKTICADVKHDGNLYRYRCMVCSFVGALNRKQSKALLSIISG